MPEELLMTMQDRDRLKVLHEVKKKHITQKEAAEQLGLSRRWVKKLMKRLRKEGDRGVMHRLRGKVSNRKIALKVQQKAVKIVRAEYGDFGPTLAAEYLGEQHDIAVGKETLRQWMIEDGIWKPKLAKVERVHIWRPRRSCLGELVQWDTSEHDWLEGRGEKLYLIAMVDDATSRGLARFVRHDSTEENMRLMWKYLERWGRTLGYYADKASLFYNTPKANHHKDGPELGPTQIGRALQELGIELIAAHSPQAKGRIERFFGTAQDRLVKGLRKAGARGLEEANRYLEDIYLPMWNKRFTEEAQNGTDVHRGLLKEHSLAAILSCVETRVVTNDYTIRLGGQIFQIAREQARPALRGAVVRAELRLDRTVAVRFRDRYLTVSLCETAPRPSKARVTAATKGAPARSSKGPNAGGKSHWMDHFWQRPSKPLWKAIRESDANS
jgi:DNA-binding Lrp family transcriptional regulator